MLLTSPNGLRQLGVEQACPIVTDGILLEIAGAKGVPVLSSQHEVTDDDVRTALARPGMEEASMEAGHAILLNYGWAENWGNSSLDNDVRVGVGDKDGSPSIGVEVVRWLTDRKVSLVGADSYCVEVIPNPDPTLEYPVHQEFDQGVREITVLAGDGTICEVVDSVAVNST